MSRDEPNVNVTMYQPDPNRNGLPLPENTGDTSDDRMDIACAIGADLYISLGTALCIAERILLSKWRQESLEQAWDKGATGAIAASYGMSSVRRYAQGENPYR